MKKLTLINFNHCVIGIGLMTAGHYSDDTVIKVYGNFTDVEVFVEILMTRIRIRLQELFTLEENTKGTRGHSLKLTKLRCSRDYWKHFFQTG